MIRNWKRKNKALRVKIRKIQKIKEKEMVVQ